MVSEKRKKRSEENGISFSLFLIIIISMGIVILLSMIKIYLSNQIYYESRRVNYIEREVSALREEKLMLENQVQKLKFKNRVSDTIFTIDESGEGE
jgi:cell division protein FtsL